VFLLSGLQRTIRQTAIAPPRTAPCFSTAIAAYSEHVGKNLQHRALPGETTF